MAENVRVLSIASTVSDVGREADATDEGRVELADQKALMRRQIDLLERQVGVLEGQVTVLQGQVEHMKRMLEMVAGLIASAARAN